MFPCNAVGGEVVVKQGEIGENFYVIEQVFLSHNQHHHPCHHHHHHHCHGQGMGTIQVGEPSSKAVVNIAIGDGGSFGELALIYGEEDEDDSGGQGHGFGDYFCSLY